MSEQPSNDLVEQIHSPRPPDSPSPRLADGVYEVKFLLDEILTEEVLKRARAIMPVDPNVDPSLDDRYQVNSVYFDNDQLGVFTRQAGFRRSKFRVRRYGDAPQVFLERKSKSRGVVRKRRTIVPYLEFFRALEPLPDAAWQGYWFHRRIVRRALKPTCHVAYERTARVDKAPEGSYRLTVDRHLRCQVANRSDFTLLESGNPMLGGKSILELKFRQVLPSFFHSLIRELNLLPVSVSKYRQAVITCGLNVGVYGAEQQANDQGEARCRSNVDEDGNLRRA